jgi:hypothetical protein
VCVCLCRQQLRASVATCVVILGAATVNELLCCVCIGLLVCCKWVRKQGVEGKHEAAGPMPCTPAQFAAMVYQIDLVNSYGCRQTVPVCAR